MKNNPKPWLYGPNWQGIRCEARTRRGTPCQRPARLPVGRCKLHGGASTGPRTKDGLARLTEFKIKHGKFTKEKRAEARRFAEEGRQMRGELKALEAWFVDCLGPLKLCQYLLTNGVAKNGTETVFR